MNRRPESSPNVKLAKREFYERLGGVYGIAAVVDESVVTKTWSSERFFYRQKRESNSDS